MRSRYSRVFLYVAVWCIVYLYQTEAPADWPTWRHDASRSGATPEQLSDDLSLQWVLELPKPQPCWPSSQVRLQFDLSYEPIATDGLLFVPSMIDDSMTAYDIESGEMKWRFFTDGPVRFPAAGINGKVYFVSDDGFLYCLKAQTGELVWKFRGGPSNRVLLGNERLISIWPARGAPVLYDGAVYFAAGIWPFMGTFIHALDAETGEVIWTNSGSSSDFMLQPHASPAFAGVAPQGCLLATEDKLFVAGGRSVPAAYDRHTGEFLYFQTNTKKGHYKSFIAGDRFVNDIQMYDIKNGKTLAAIEASIADGESFVGLAPDGRIQAYGLKTDKEKYLDKKGNEKTRNVSRKIWWTDPGAKFDRLFIKAGSRFYLGANDGRIAAVEVVQPAKTAAKSSIIWQSKIDGVPWQMLAADKRLFVVTEEGRIYCFGEKYPYAIERPLIPTPAKPDKVWNNAAGKIIRATGVSEGYCLVLGAGTGKLAEAFYADTDLVTIVLEPNPKKVKTLKQKWADAGLYGKRLSIITGDIVNTRMPQYLASLIVSENLNAARFDSENFPIKVFDSLRPYGGTACFVNPAGTGIFQPADLDTTRWQTGAQRFKAAALPNAVLEADENHIVVKRPGPLPGASEWTHQYGNVSNTVCSKDTVVKAPLGLLWFGGPSHEDVLPRHGHGPPQQVVGGRLFIQGIGVINARDVYTGRTLWRREMQELDTFNMYYDKTHNPDPHDRTYNQVHIPGANALGSNFIATRDRIYIVIGPTCIVLDAATGETLDEWTFPEQPGEGKINWGYIGVYEDKLAAAAAPLGIKSEKGKNAPADRDAPEGPKAAADEIKVIVEANAPFSVGSQYLAVMDRFTGKPGWSRKAAYNFRHNTIVAGNGKVFCIDGMSEQRMSLLKRYGIAAESKPSVLALDIGNGELLWSDDENVFGTWLGYSEEFDALLQAGSFASDRAKDESKKGMAAYQGADGTLLWKNDLVHSGPCILHHEKIITQTGGPNTAAPPAPAFRLLTGEQLTIFHPITGQEIPWSWVRFKGCNTAIASEHLLTFRSAAAAYVDLTTGQGTATIGGFKSGCTSNLVAADGVLNAPDYTRTCTCSYQNQTSLALVHMPADKPDSPSIPGWSFNYLHTPSQAEPVERLGINFGAAGNQFDSNGTLWLEFPNVGGPSPDVPVHIESRNASLFRRHPSAIPASEDGIGWVAASGIEGAATIKIRPFVQPEKQTEDKRVHGFEHHSGKKELERKNWILLKGRNKVPKPYTIRLHFAETNCANPGERVFDVFLQNEKVLENFNVSKLAPTSNAAIIREFRRVMVKDDLLIELKPTESGSKLQPLICGVEILAGER